MDLDDLLATALRHGADSLQFRPGSPPLAYVGKRPMPLSHPNMTADSINGLLARIATELEQATLVGTGRLQGEYAPDPSHGLPRMVYRAKQTPNGPAMGFRPAATALAQPAGHAPEPARAAAPAQTGQDWGWPTDNLDALLAAVVDRRAADLLLSSGREARVRIMGGFDRIPGAVYDDQGILGLFGDDFTDERRETLERAGNVDLAYQLTHQGRRHRFRVNVFRQMDGLAAAFRPIWDTVPTLADLNLPPQIIDLAEFPYGLVLMTGPTGSGKSTTLATLIEHLNRTYQRHIVTLEDPIEYVFSQGQSIVHQREVGHHVDSFAGGLRAALREAPDVILVGEMRDLETIAAALTAAETGHLVLSTLHSGSAAQAIDRIIDIFPEHQQSQVRIQLADVLRAIVTQRLMPRADQPGRVPAVELVRVNYAVSNLIRDKRTHQFSTQIQTGRNDGMIPFDLSLIELVKRGMIDPEVALRSARDTRYVESQIADLELLS